MTFAIAMILYFWPSNAQAKGAICLYDSTSIRVKDNLTAIIDVYRAFEITSEAGQSFAEVAIPVNDNISVKDIKGYTELRGGSRIKLTNQDIATSTTVGFSGFGSIRLMIFTLRNPAVGSRLYYQYSLVVKSLLYLPRMARSTEYQTNRYSVDISWDKKANIFYDANGVEAVAGKRWLHFSSSNLPEMPQEANSCPDELYIMFSADAFTYNKMKYPCRNWPEIGRFFAQLSSQPEASVAQARRLAARLALGARTRLDTLNAFFNFVADSISYVALQVGKGDFNPHECQVIINRRYGDCKDQSVLLASLCRAANFEAYPALITTTEYPPLENLHPWPSWFDHAVAVVKMPSGDLILDPSDPRASVTSIPPRLRGKDYIICDGISGLGNTPAEVDPAFKMSWEFQLQNIGGDGLRVDFNWKLEKDAADIYEDAWKGKDLENIKGQVESQLKYAGWDASSLNLDPIHQDSETLSIHGNFVVKVGEPSEPKNLAIASPVIAYMLGNLFPEVRQNDYCPGGSIELDEKITIDRSVPYLVVSEPYKESWERAGISFEDKLNYDDRHAVFSRSFSSSGDAIRAAHYNQLRDFILSRRNQQYVRIQK